MHFQWQIRLQFDEQKWLVSLGMIINAQTGYNTQVIQKESEMHLDLNESKASECFITCCTFLASVLTHLTL